MLEPAWVPGSGQFHVRLVTSLGDIVIRLEEDRAPNTVKNFAGLATGAIDWKDPKSGAPMQGTPMYDGTRFHRVIPNFMIQAGDPLSRYPDQADRWGTDGPGVVSMANSGPGTNGSQWFITEDATPHLDDKHTVFGPTSHQ
ncbi:peptidylprolyl isomerase [Streptomyces sp. NPDC001091]